MLSFSKDKRLNVNFTTSQIKTKMKRIALLTIFSLTLMSFIGHGQNHPKGNVELLLNKELKVKNGEPYYDFFYKDKSLERRYISREIENEIVGKTYKVDGYKPFLQEGPFGEEHYYILELKNTEQNIFYKYNPNSDLFYPFEVIGGLELSDDFYCQNIIETYDKFTGETTVKSKPIRGISFMKIVKEEKCDYYLWIQNNSTSLFVEKKGVIILLNNEKRIEKPEQEIDVNVSQTGGSYIYKTFIKLDNNDIELLTNNEITDIRLYVIDGVVEDGKELMENLKCLTRKYIH